MKKLVLASVVATSLFSCNNDLTTQEEALTTANASMSLKGNKVALQAHSVTPNFLKLKPGFKNLSVYPILSSEDVLVESPNFVYGSMADGAALMKNEDGTFTLINNIEADYSIARITLDETFKPVHGEYILNAAATANTAQCSGSLITPEEHGFGPLYLSGGEWGGASKGVFATDPFKDANEASVANLLPALGQWSTENAVAMHKNAFPGKTVVLIGDDTSDNNIPSGQLAMYVGDHADLENGNLYGLKVLTEGVNFEMDMKEGVSYDITFEEYSERTLDELETESRAKGIMGFSRVEDIDWRKGSSENNREFFFAVTGRKKDALLNKGSFYGRIYHVILDENNPLSGTITCVLDGDILDGKAKEFHSPDNLVVTENYVYIQEDPNGYPDTPEKSHFAQLYEYNIVSKNLKTVLECDQELAAGAGYGSTSNDWEITGMIDISETVGVDRTFLLITQNHGWTDANFTDPLANPNPASNEGSMLYVIQGLKR
ncbi:PhoX family protein [Aestuariibaculum sp. M13]|uniref:PhoX family protein n=1 Tax=Aestuariibaculum sp. M13 TaxID=2967132 RepID=UPI002159E2C2|nr:PhoX family protein [Aestuariibaculum sp. M13]MCR8669126.1 PhoX family protein [Aestuariibaculum sp. M13]